MSAFDLVELGATGSEQKHLPGLGKRQAMFVDGDGADHKPVGLLTHVDKGQGVQRIDSVGTISAGCTIQADDLINLTYELETEYLDGACWVMSRATARQIRKLKYPQGEYIWQDGLEGNKTTLLGYPIHFVDEMPALGVNGTCPVVFGNLHRAYTIVNHTTGTRLVRDELTKKPYVLLDSTRYCGANVVDGQAVKALKTKKTS